MAISERERLALYDRLGELLGHEQAGWMMELLPPTSWADLATKDDLSLLRGEIEIVKSDVSTMGKELRAELQAGFALMDQRFADIDQRFADVTQGFASMDQRFAEVDRTISDQTRMFVTLLVGFAITIWLSLLGAAIFT